MVSGGFTEKKHRFNRAVFRGADEMAALVTRAGMAFERAHYEGLAGLYATDAVKVFVPEDRGKRAAQLETADLERHTAQWRDELAVLAAHGAFPHLILIFGTPFWDLAWKTFHPKDATAARFGVQDMRAAQSELRHHLNRIRRGDGEADTLLVRLRHPVARTRIGSPKWVAAEGAREPLLRRRCAPKYLPMPAGPHAVGMGRPLRACPSSCQGCGFGCGCGAAPVSARLGKTRRCCHR